MSYFNRLSKRQQKIYLASDKIKSVTLTHVATLKTASNEIEQALLSADVDRVEGCCQQFIDLICRQFNFVTASAHVLERRPHNNYGDCLLYTSDAADE